MAAVFGNVGRRLVEGVVGLFALLGFLYVPLGRHTGFEHALAVLRTPAASEAMQDVLQAAAQLRQRAVDLLTGRTSLEAPADRGPSVADRQNHTSGHGPRPSPPPLK